MIGSLVAVKDIAGLMALVGVITEGISKQLNLKGTTVRIVSVLVALVAGGIFGFITTKDPVTACGIAIGVGLSTGFTKDGLKKFVDIAGKIAKGVSLALKNG